MIHARMQHNKIGMHCLRCGGSDLPRRLIKRVIQL